MILTLKKGRPEIMDGREEKEIKCYDFLDNLGVEYYHVDHRDMPADTMEACVAVDKALDCKICKNLFLCNRQKTVFYLLMMPADKPFKTKDLTAQINSARLSFAEASAMLKYLNITPGAVSVLGLMNDSECNVRLLVDKDILTDEYIGCHPCVNTTSMKIKTDDIFDKIISATNHTKLVVELPWHSEINQ
ncbi:MAG: prolyl-tRNA synthetase associated domain-containing protein [Clostridia bacterium]|nr:prolyl-tRNA synthetase associated domain-containing protein [Clostridia bacterium]